MSAHWFPKPPRERLNVFEETGGTCRRQSKTCKRTECRMHMAAIEDAKARVGRPTTRPPVVMVEACVLDAADKGGLSLEEVARRLGITRERVRQIEQIGMRRFNARIKDLCGLDDDEVQDLLYYFQQRRRDDD